MKKRRTLIVGGSALLLFLLWLSVRALPKNEAIETVSENEATPVALEAKKVALTEKKPKPAFIKKPVLSNTVELEAQAQAELTKCVGYSEKTLEAFSKRLLATHGKPERETPLLINHHFELENGRTIRIHQGQGEESDSINLKLSIYAEDPQGDPEPVRLEPELEGKSPPEVIEYYKKQGKLILSQEQRLLSYADGTELEIQKSNSWIENLEWHSPTKTLSCGIIFDPESTEGGSESVSCKCLANDDANPED